MDAWTVSEPTQIDVPGPVRAVHVTVVSGDVDVIAGDVDGAHVEVTAITGADLRVSLDGDVLRVGYDDLGWDKVLGWLRGQRRKVSLSVAVPEECDVRIGVVSADAVVTGTKGLAEVRSVSGEVVLDALSGRVTGKSVSGDLECRALAGNLAFDSVSGDLTVVEGSPASVRAHAVSGDVILDIEPDDGALVDLKTVSGDVTVRLPTYDGTSVDVRSTSGRLSATVDGLTQATRPGQQTLHGVLGGGTVTLRARTVSGDVSLLVREPS